MTFYLRGQYYTGRYIAFWECGRCGKAICTESYADPKETNILEFSKCEKIYPSSKEYKAPYGTPKEIADAYVAALSNSKSGLPGCWIAATIMARKSIELAVNDFGGEGKDLFTKINDLASRNIITPALREWAHTIRDIGNAGAHKEGASREDAEQAVYFAETLFIYLYTLPKMIEERRNKKA